MRLLTTEKRMKLEAILNRLSRGSSVSLSERIELKKYSSHIPFIAGKLNQALKKRELLENEGLI